MDENKTNSSLIQSLLDLKTFAIDANDDIVLNQITTLLKSLETKDSLVLKADKKTMNRKYNHTKMEFVKCKDIKHNQIIFNLSSNAAKLLSFSMISITQDNCIELKLTNVMRILHISKQSLMNAIDELENTGCLIIYKKTSKKSGKGNLYMLNPTIAYSGKLPNQSAFDSLVKTVDSSRLDTFAEFSNPDESVNYVLDDTLNVSYHSFE